MVEIFQFRKNKLGKPWLAQLAIGETRKIYEVVKACPMDMNGLNTREDLNIIPLGSYCFLIGMDWLDMHHVLLDFYNKDFTCLDEEGNLKSLQRIPRDVTIREVLSLQLNKSFGKGCQLFVAHMEDKPNDKTPNIEDYAVLKEF
jgi:hypothetical protein